MFGLSVISEGKGSHSLSSPHINALVFQAGLSLRE
jgi:hypothetical protein